MPEGHTIHRLARDLDAAFADHVVRVSSPQGRFAGGATALDGARLVETDAHGKHLFLGFDTRPAPRWVHIHLGLYGTFRLFAEAAAEPWGAVRMRLEAASGHADLRGPTRCELIDASEKDLVHARLGPDPIRGDDPVPAFDRIGRSAASIGVLLMDQAVIAGVGNVYRAEVLFRAGLDPAVPGREVDRGLLGEIWADLVGLMAAGVKVGRIDTVRPEHEPSAMGRAARRDAHGGEVYVYRRDGMPCHLCGTEIRRREAAARNVFWCPRCQS